MRQLPIFIMTITLAAGVGQACGGSERAHGGPEAADDGTRSRAASASAERRIITLTGCLRRDVQPGTFALVSVGSAGVLDAGGPQGGESDRTGASADATADNSTDAAVAGASYRLIATDADQGQEMGQYENQRVAVRGRLAADVPVGTAGDAGQVPQGGTVVESTETSATVQGSAPPLRGFHVESVKKVGDSCSAQ